jgi:hypothetical protein
MDAACPTRKSWCYKPRYEPNPGSIGLRMVAYASIASLAVKLNFAFVPISVLAWLSNSVESLFRSAPGGVPQDLRRARLDQDANHDLLGMGMFPVS